MKAAFDSAILEKAASGVRLNLEELVALYDAPLPELAAVAHELRLKRTTADTVTYLIDRNINYTNICNVGCNFCAFYRTPRQGDAYTLTYEQIGQKVAELEAIGGTRILMQGGVNPAIPFQWYVDLLRYLKQHHPKIKIDAFSPEEILGFEKFFDMTALEVLTQLKDAGLDGLPGAGGEILEDEVRLEAAPARIHASDWFRIIDVAQSLQLYTISTMVIGFGETMTQRVSHMLKLRDQQDQALEKYNNAFYGFAMWTLQTENTRLHGKAPGASAHEYLQNLAISRIALDNIPNIQVSWPTLGFKVGQVGLFYGANDFGSTMMEENVVSQAAGHDRVRVTEREIIRHIDDAGFKPAQRDSRFNILRYPDVQTALSKRESRASEEIIEASLEVPNELEAVNAAAR
jgi:cyclic dehypoxanthinyl futalosine synthase